MSNKLFYSKIRNVKNPIRSEDRSSGIDFFVPKLTEDVKEYMKKCIQNADVIFDKNKIIIPPNAGVMIPSGIKVNLPQNYDMTFTNKSGVCSKKGLIVGACLIDESYMGEMHINLWNVSSKNVEIFEDEKIIQGVMREINYFSVEETELENLYLNKVSDRKDGGFGSTN